MNGPNKYHNKPKREWSFTFFSFFKKVQWHCVFHGHTWAWHGSSNHIQDYICTYCGKIKEFEDDPSPS